MDADPELKRAWAEAMDAPATAHLPEDAWEQLLSEGAPSAERARAFEHISECALCTTTYRELLQLRDAARAFDPGAPAAVRPVAARPAWIWLGAAAAIVLAVLVGRHQPGPAAGPTPAASASDTLRSGDDELPLPQEPRGALARTPAHFRWRPAVHLGSYRVELLSASGTTLWSSAEVTQGLADWPAELQLDAGRYYWRVVGKPGSSSTAAEAVASPLVQIDLGASTRR